MLKRGFTMVEILVVVAIISLLSAVIYVSFDDSRSAAKNRAIQTEVKEVQLAIELYRAQEGRYPPATSGSGCYSTASGIERAENSNGTCANWQYLNALTPQYVPELPESRDSSNPNCSIEYQVDTGGGWYKLTAERCLEGIEAPEDGIGEDEEFSRCPSSCGTCGGPAYDETAESFYESLAVYSFGGQCR